MTPFLGFALVTHNQPEQTALLCRRLSAMFHDPPIAIHHDYSKCNLDPAILPKQVKIVKDYVVTQWGKSTVIDAYLAALRLLHANDAPEWTISLSAADYPIQSAAYILDELRSTSSDGFFDFRDVSKGRTQPTDARSHASAFQRPDWMTAAYERYVSFSVVPHAIRKHIGYKDRCIYVSGNLVTRLFTPFSETYRPFGGDWWHTINRRAATVLLADDAWSRRLRRFYDRRASPEESYYHTLLLNRPELVIENDNRRYTIWAEGQAHPKLLEYADIPAMVASGAHFARKFPFDPELYSAVDEYVHSVPRSS